VLALAVMNACWPVQPFPSLSQSIGSIVKLSLVLSQLRLRVSLALAINVELVSRRVRLDCTGMR